MCHCPLLWRFAIAVVNTWRIEREAQVKALLAAGGNLDVERRIFEISRRDARRAAARAAQL